jgi:hypothetical protein
MLRYLPYIFTSLFISNISYAQEIPEKDYKPNIIVHTGIQFSLHSLPKHAKWQGLYCKDKLCEVKDIKVKIGKTLVDYLDNQKVPLDTIKVNGNPIAIFPNKKFKTGKITKFYSLDPSKDYESTYTNNKQYNSLEDEKKWVMPWGSQPLTLFWTQINDKENPDRSDYRDYQITDGKRTQSLFKIDGKAKYETNTTPVIFWVGDLDGDNKLDIILEIPDDNCGFDYRLYLSSKAVKDEILHQELRFTGNQDACGC